MGFTPSVNSTISLATTAVVGANFGSTCFVTTNAYMVNRLKAFTSFEQVREDTTIPSTSNAYQALKLAFSVSGGASVPIYLGRRDWDDITLTPDVINNNDYTVTFVTVDETTFEEVKYLVEYTSDNDATDLEICAGLKSAFDLLTPTGVTLTDNLDGTLTADKTSGYGLYMESLTDLVDTYTTTESAADLYSALVLEGEEDFYFLCCEDHTQDFVLAMASEVEASESSDYPKQYHVSVQETTALVTLPEPAIDTLGKLKELGYLRTHGQWHNEADTLFPEVGPAAYTGKYTPGTTNWKFIPQIGGLTAAQDPSTGKELSKTKVGYVVDRNANLFASERGVTFYRTGKMVGGEWTDIVHAKDYLNDSIETGLLNLLLNQPGSKISFTKADKARVAAVIDGVLDDAVADGILSGYIPTVVPETVSFSDQANRILKDVEWTGYLSGAVNTIYISGILTYSEEELS